MVSGDGVNSKADRCADIIIVGGGSAGLAAGTAVKAAAPELDLIVIDAAPPDRIGGTDYRASAIAAAARRMLAQLGVWGEVADEAQAIVSMDVTDSRTSDAVRPVFLSFDDTTRDGEPFAHMVPNRALLGALKTQAVERGVAIVAPETVRDFSADESGATVELGSGETLGARLIVAADGVRSRLRGLSGIKTVTWRYPQIAIVATIDHERPHGGVAVEHFLPAGPFAILPLKGNRSSLVWAEEEAFGRRLVEGDDFVFLSELERRVGHRLGRLSLCGPRQAYPLGLTLARDFVRPRFALLGDAAHGIHPIAGQGLNLGFRDVAALAETLIDAHRLGLDFGAVDVLRGYERWRRFDTWQMGVVTDTLNRLFGTDLAPVRAVRDLGLGIVDRMPALKRRFITEAAGLGGNLPKLLRGEAL